MDRATAANLVGDHESTIAFHFEQTHQYRSELGPIDDETRALGRRAATLLRPGCRRELSNTTTFPRRAPLHVERSIVLDEGEAGRPGPAVDRM